MATSQAASLGPFVFLPVLSLGYTLGTTVLEVVTNEVTPRPVRAMVFGLVACLGGLGGHRRLLGPDMGRSAPPPGWGGSGTGGQGMRTAPDPYGNPWVTVPWAG